MAEAAAEHVEDRAAVDVGRAEKLPDVPLAAGFTLDLLFGERRVLDKFPDIVVRLADMADRFCTVLDCVDLGFLPDGTLDRLPLPSQIGRIGSAGST